MQALLIAFKIAILVANAVSLRLHTGKKLTAKAIAIRFVWDCVVGVRSFHKIVGASR